MERYREDLTYSYSLGMSLTIEALLHRPFEVKEVVLSQKASKNSQLDLLFRLCDENHVRCRYDETFIKKLSVKENCYCIGVFDKFSSKISGKRHVLLYGFNDFGELGTVLRSAVAFDFSDIVLIGSDIDIFDPRCIRASMGSIFHIGLERCETLQAYKDAYPDHTVYPFVSSSKTILGDIVFNEPFGLLISQDPHALDGMEGGIALMKDNGKTVSLSIRSSIILEEAYDQNRRR